MDRYVWVHGGVGLCVYEGMHGGVGGGKRLLQLYL